MSEILWKSAGEDETGQAADHAHEASTLALSADDFSALEERILRAVGLLKRERQARAEAEERAAQAKAELSDKGLELERLEHDVKQLRAERDHVRQRVDKLLKQFDDMTTMMKRMNKLGQKGLMRQGIGALMPGMGGGGGFGGGRRPY